MKVLVYDSNCELKPLYQAILAPSTDEVTFTSDLDTAKRNALLGSHRLLIWDMNFPEMDGLLAAENLLRYNSDQAMILICGIPVTPGLMDTIQQMPFRAVLTKPFDIDRLRSLVHKEMTSHRTKRTLPMRSLTTQFEVAV